MLVMLALVTIKWRQEEKIKSLTAFIAWIGLSYVTINNNMHWTNTTNTNATIERFNLRKAELENDSAIALLKEAYSRALANEREVKANETTVCKVFDSTACKRFKTVTLPRATQASEQASTAYQTALANANRKAERETSPIAPMQSL